MVKGDKRTSSHNVGRYAVGSKTVSPAEQTVDTAIASNNVVVFSKSYCPFCDRTKALLSSLGIKHTAIELDQRSDGRDIQSVLARKTGQRTVPSVWVAGRHIGGNDDTHALHRSGGLVALVKKGLQAQVAASKVATPTTTDATAAGRTTVSGRTGGAGAGAGAGSKRTPSDEVDTIIASHAAVVFSKSYCPYCLRTKKLLASLNIPAHVVELDGRSDGSALQSALLAKTGQRTVPSVWVGGEFLGGNSETQALHRAGKLVPLAAAATKA